MATFPFLSTPSDLDDDDRMELNQRTSAVVATMACDIPRRVIKEGSRLAAIALKPRIVSKYEYNQNRVRDFRVCKEGEDVLAIGDVPDDEITAKSFDPYPSAFTRDYCRGAFQGGTMKLLHDKLWSFEFIRLIDVSELLIGDDGFIKLCDGLHKCPVQSLILTNNHISDKGMLHFADMWRSMAQLDTLKLANNKFTDKSVELMLHPTRYSPSIRALDLSKNRIGVRTAFYLGLMFVHERVGRLEDLTIGVRVGSLSHGDHFVMVLAALLTAPRARPIHKLDLSDAGLSDLGIKAVASIIACSYGLKEVHISRNYISPRMRSLLYRSLVANKSVNVFRYYYCGFNHFEEERIKRLGYTNLEGAEKGVGNVISPAMPPQVHQGRRSSRITVVDAAALKYKNKVQLSTPKSIRRPVLSWSECIDLCDVVSRILYTSTVQMRKVLEGVSHNDTPPTLTANKMFATEARGKLTVLQQISMFGRRSLKTTPLRDELDALKYVTVRPVPISFKKAMYLLGEIQKMNGYASSEEGGSVQDSESAWSVMDSLEAGPQLYIKLIYSEVIYYEKWLNYLQTLHLNRSMKSAISARSKDSAVADSVNNQRAVDDDHFEKKYSWACEFANDRLDVIRALSSDQVNLHAVVDILMEQANAQEQIVQPPLDHDQRTQLLDDIDDDASTVSTGVSSIGDGSATGNTQIATLAPIASTPLKTASTNQSLASSQSRAVVTNPAETATEKFPIKVLTGYDFLFTHRANIFPSVLDQETSDDRSTGEEGLRVLEVTAMSLEDYASALEEKLTACEMLIARNVRDCIAAESPDMDFRNILRLPFYDNIGLPSFYVHSCLVELLKKDKNADSNDVYSHNESTTASTSLDIQIKRKKKESRKQRKIVGRRFDVRKSFKMKPEVHGSIKENEEYLDGESLTMDSLGAGGSIETAKTLMGGSGEYSMSRLSH